MVKSVELKRQCQAYLGSRTSTYKFRCIRFKAVADRLDMLGLDRRDTIVDVGAGRMDFARYMRSRGWQGEYIPIEGSLDGTDLNFWTPPHRHHFFVAIEVVEHVYDPIRLMKVMSEAAIKGSVCTTPNSETVDVLGCDPTHVSVITNEMWKSRGWDTETTALFKLPYDDSIVAWK